MDETSKKPAEQNKQEKLRGRKPEQKRSVENHRESDKPLERNPIPSEQIPDNPSKEHITVETPSQGQTTTTDVSEKAPREQDVHREVPKQAMQQEMYRTSGKTRTQEEAVTNPEGERFVPDAEHKEPIRPSESLAEPIASPQPEYERFAGNSEPMQPQLFRPAQESAESTQPKKMPRVALVQQMTKHTEKAAAEIREQIYEQPDMSPSEYAEQKTEQYTGMVVHRAESAVDRAGYKLRDRTIRHFREKLKEERQADRECDYADAEIQNSEADTPAEQIREEHRYRESNAESVAEPEHLTYRDRPEQLQHTEPATQGSTAGSFNEQRGGRNHAQRQAKRSDWETNASGYHGSGAVGYNATYPASEAQYSAVPPAQRLASGTEKEAHTAAQATNNSVRATQQAAKTAEQTAADRDERAREGTRAA